VRVTRAGVRSHFQQLKISRASACAPTCHRQQSGPGFSAFAEVLRVTGAQHERAMRGRAAELLRSDSRHAGLAAALSYGQKKLLELAMALMTDRGAAARRAGGGREPDADRGSNSICCGCATAA
jgi:ABC-type branched-subunit amino acid transport system ATPase component